MRPGEVVGGRFRLEGLAGAGGMGAIWRAVDVATTERVALKVMLQHANDPSRFVHEARMLSQLKHPTIVRYVAHGATHDGLLYLAMEWLEGDDLAERLARGPFRVADALALGARLADALGEAHDAGIVHRDVKPANVFLPKGKIEDAKLMDFGIARAKSYTERYTQPGRAVGTIGYMAPEQARGAPDVGPQADVFALGCVLFECLTAKPLFAGEHWVAVLAKVLVHEAAHLSDVMSDAPPELEALLERMLAKEPAERPADGHAVARELRALLARKLASMAPRALPALSSEEIGVASVVLVGQRPGALLTNTIDASVAQQDTARLKEFAAQRGARLERLADGSLLAVAEGGLPMDQAAKAARAALALHEALPDRPAAVATGRAPLGRRVPLGEAIDTAAELVRQPAAQGVRIDAATASLLGPSFVFAHGILSAEVDEISLSGIALPCVGRDRDLAELEGLFDECVAESVARAALVCAPPGAGKSHLLAELLPRLRTRADLQLWFGRGDPVGAGSAFSILAGAMRNGLKLAAGTPLEAQRATLLARAGAPAAHFLGEMLGVPFSAASEDGPVSEQLVAARRDPQLMHERIRRTFEEFVSRECTRAPLVVVLEDLQWGDAPSVRLLDGALRAAADLPLFVLAFGRPEALSTFPNLWSERSLQRLELLPLAPRASLDVVKRLLPHASDEVVARIVQEGGGNPLLLEELVRAEREHATRTVDDAPRTLAAMLHARLERVAPELRLVLRAASVFGRTFWLGAVRSLVDVGEAELEARVARLLDAELVARSPSSKFATEPELYFRSDLTREATYGSLTDADRKLGHRLAGEWLAHAGLGDALVLAEHFERGGEGLRAAGEYLRAARRAAAASDFAGAFALAGKGLACGAMGSVRGSLLLLQAETKQWMGGLDAASELLDLALRDLDEGSEDWFSAMALLGLGEFRRGHRTESEAIAAHILRPRSSASGIAASRLLEFASALVIFGQTELGARLGARAHIADDPGARGELLAFRAMQAYMDGDLEGALEGEQMAVELLQRAGDLRAASLELLNAAYFRFELGDHETAENLILRAAELRRQLGISHHNLQNLARVVARRGAVDEAIALEQSAIEANARSGDARIEGFSRAHLAELMLARGDHERAEKEARAACDLLLGTPTLRPVALATLANVLRARGRFDAALDAATTAAEAAKGGVESGEASIALALAEALWAVGQHERARATLAASARRLLDRAGRIHDPSLNKSFLTRVPDNARTLDLVRSWGAGEAQG